MPAMNASTKILARERDGARRCLIAMLREGRADEPVMRAFLSDFLCHQRTLNEIEIAAHSSRVVK